MAVSTNKVNLSGLARKLVVDGLMEEAAAAQAFQDALKKRRPFVSHLVENKLAEPLAIAQAAAEEFGVPLFDINALDLDLDILEAKKRSRTFAHLLDRLSLKIPVVGDMLNKAAIARFARTLSTMFAAGTPLVEAMVSVAGASGNIIYHDAIMKMRDDIATGTQLQVAMRDTQLFPNMVVQMVAIGEEAGSLDQMLAKVADFYEEEVDNAIDALSSLLEPLIMAFLGVIIGGLVVAMYLPIFQMGQVV